MKIGAITLRPVVEIEQITMPAEVFISDITLDDVAPHLHWLSPQFFDATCHHCRLSQHAWLIEAHGKRIIVDPCVGHQRHRPVLPFFHMIDSPLLDNLAAMGVAPEEVDYVFCTHLHLDHVGWNTRLQNGRFVPTFPNARYLFSDAENEYWRRELTTGLAPDEVVNEGVYRECIQPVIDAGLADIIAPGLRIADCLTLIEAGGHTIGHLAGLLESEGEGAVLAGDAIHHPIQVLFPDRAIHGFDPACGQATRH